MEDPILELVERMAALLETLIRTNSVWNASPTQDEAIAEITNIRAKLAAEIEYVNQDTEPEPSND